MKANQNPTNTALLTTALSLFAQGLWIVPCRRKQPLLTNWQAERLSTDELERYLTDNPDANIAFVIGQSDFVDVECDSEAAESNLLQMFKDGGSDDIPKTPTYQSKRGKHRLFKRPADLPEKATVTIDSVEFRIGGGGKGALSILPPSVHPDGPEYQWLEGCEIFKIEPAQLPSAIVEQINEQAASKPSLILPTGNGQIVIPNGHRNEMLLSAAGVMRRKGLGEAAILAALKVHNAAVCQPPLSDAEVVGIAKSVSQYPPSDPGLVSLNSLNSQCWPTLDPKALIGLPGEIVAAIAPYTEADPVATLVNLVVMYGNVIGSNACCIVGHSAHPARVNAVLVGTTSKGRKGTSLSAPKRLFGTADPEWADRMTSGLSTGEGLIKAVSSTGSDKRLLVVEEEFASPLIVMNRRDNTLSTALRQAWDSGNLSVMTRNDPLKATDAHISIIGHVTADELKNHLTETHKANGFANRFLWTLVKRSKSLPDGGAPPRDQMDALAEKLSAAIAFGKQAGEVTRNEQANQLWWDVYEQLSEGKPGLLGATLSRAEAQTLRLSLIYALFNQSNCVRKEHLQAALALWRYCEESAVFIFGGSSGDPLEDRVFKLLDCRNGKSRTDINRELGGHISSTAIDGTLSNLTKHGRARRESVPTPGRTKTLWFKVAKKAK